MKVSLKFVSWKTLSLSSRWGQYWAHLICRVEQTERTFDLGVANRTSWRKVPSRSPILSRWLGSASPRRGSAAPTPSPRNCHTCSEGVPALREKTDLYPQISRSKKSVCLFSDLPQGIWLCSSYCSSEKMQQRRLVNTDGNSCFNPLSHRWAFRTGRNELSLLMSAENNIRKWFLPQCRD